MPANRHLAVIFFTSALFALTQTAHAQTPLLPTAVQPTGAIWPAGDGFRFEHKSKKTRQSVSGIACAPYAQGRNICLLVFDEGVSMRFAQVGDGRLRPIDQGLTLGREGAELDAEGAATDGAYFYVTGSHAVKRQSCDTNPASQHVLRFRREASTGLATLADVKDHTGLLPMLAKLPELAAYTGPGHCLGTGGIDIEGLALRAGRLFFGLRGPTVQGTAFIVSVDAEAFFKGGDAKARVHPVQVGAGRGIRDLLAAPDGILLLAGPDDAERNAGLAWTVLRWNDGAAIQPLATLDLRPVQLRRCDKAIKPEAMALLDADVRRYRLLVLSDGLCDGGAMAFDIPR